MTNCHDCQEYFDINYATGNIFFLTFPNVLRKMDCGATKLFLTKESRIIILSGMKHLTREKEISKRVLKFIKESGLSPHAIARKAGIDPANFYRMLEGMRGWHWRHLEKLAKVFGISVDELVGGAIEVPVIARISALEHFPTPGRFSETLYFVKHSGERNMQIEGLYALEVADRSMMPVFKPGTKFIIEKDSFRSITNYDLVVCPTEEAKARLACLNIEAEHITLRSLNSMIADLVLPITHLKLCERVIAIYPG